MLTFVVRIYIKFPNSKENACLSRLTNKHTPTRLFLKKIHEGFELDSLRKETQRFIVAPVQ